MKISVVFSIVALTLAIGGVVRGSQLILGPYTNLSRGKQTLQVLIVGVIAAILTLLWVIVNRRLGNFGF
jgi:hypothetical protein